ncbi:hypothetical protein ACLB2K_018335 [Fragaria x ananassa]
MSVKSSFVIFFFVTIVSSISQAEGFSFGGFEHREIPVPVVSPESVAFDCSEAVYAGLHTAGISNGLGANMDGASLPQPPHLGREDCVTAPLIKTMSQLVGDF